MYDARFLVKISPRLAGPYVRTRGSYKRGGLISEGQLHEEIYRKGLLRGKSFPFIEGFYIQALVLNNIAVWCYSQKTL